MKTVSQIAKDNNVSVQTIYRLLNRVKQNSEECLTEKFKGITYITSDGEKLITDSLTSVKQENNNMLNSVKQENEDMLNDVKHVKQENNDILSNVKDDNINMFNSVKHVEHESNKENNEILFMRERIEFLENELKIEREHSREQSTKVIALAEQLTDLTRNNQVLLGIEQNKNINEDISNSIPEENKKSFWSKLLGR